MTASEDSLALLDDYSSGAMSDEHASIFEEALFAAAAAGQHPELTHLDALYDQAQWFAVRGGFPSGATAELVSKLRALPRVHHIDVGPVTRVAAWPEGTQLVVYRVGVDLRGYESIDVSLETTAGEHRKWFRDVQFDPLDGALYGVCDAPLARTTFRIEPLVLRVHAAQNGQRSVVAELRIFPE